VLKFKNKFGRLRVNLYSISCVSTEGCPLQGNKNVIVTNLESAPIMHFSVIYNAALVGYTRCN
jgi:hypothetical protein